MPLASETFTQHVKNYCTWVEGDLHTLKSAREHLILLMADIPFLEEYRDGEVKGEYSRREHGEWEKDCKRFTDLPFQYYQTVFDAHELSSEDPVTGYLQDDLADIYGDLLEGLQAHLVGETIDALRIWVDSYFCHWGYHLISALKAIDDFYRQGYGVNTK